MRARGSEFACWHSDACRDGELGANPMSDLEPITFEQFKKAAEADWPYQPGPITRPGPVAWIGKIDPESGRITPTWDSLGGDHG